MLALEKFPFMAARFGALSITHTLKYREPFEPLVPGVEFVRFNTMSRTWKRNSTAMFARSSSSRCRARGGIFPRERHVSGKRARELATQHGRSADRRRNSIAAWAARAEPLPTSGLRACRTSSWLQKPLAGGLPLGRLFLGLAREEFAAAFSPGLHGSTFGGGPLVCANGFDLSRPRSSGSTCSPMCARRGAELAAPGLKKLAAKFDFIREGAREKGLMLGVGLDVEGRSLCCRGPPAGPAHQLHARNTTLRLLPPFILTAQQVKEGLSKLDSVFAKTERPAKTQAVPPTTRPGSGARGGEVKHECARHLH